MIGYDARRKSDVFALDTARVMAAHGIRALVLPGPQPTPVVAWALTELDGAAGVVVTASHNPPQDNGYKVYLGDGPQIVPPHDLGIAERIGLVDPTAVALAPEDDPLIEWLDDSIVERYVASMPRGAASTGRRPACPWRTRRCTVSAGEVVLRAFAAAGVRPRRWWWPSSSSPDPTFPTVSFPNPEEPGAMDLVMALAPATGAAIAIANDPDADRARRRDPAARRLVASTGRRRDRLVAGRSHPAHDRRATIGSS